MEKIILFLGLLGVANASYKIDRDVSDTCHGISHCAGFDRTTGYFSCTCEPQYTTMMSSEGQEYGCKTLKEVSCEYSLQETDQAYLIKEANINRPIFSGSTKIINLVMNNISIWSYDGDRSHWNDLTTFSTRYFTVRDTSGHSSLHISDLNLDAWGGHVVKIEFKDEKCLVFKVKGTVDIPFNFDEVKKKLEVSATTTVMPQTTQVVKKPPFFTTKRYPSRPCTRRHYRSTTTESTFSTTKGYTPRPCTRKHHRSTTTESTFSTTKRHHRSTTTESPFSTTKIHHRSTTTESPFSTTKRHHRSTTTESPFSTTKGPRKTSTWPGTVSTFQPTTRASHHKKIFEHLKLSLSFLFDTTFEFERED